MKLHKFSSIAVLFTLSLYFSSSNALSCSQQYECTSVSADYNYVQCVSGECVCLTANGFIGSATPEDQCRCPFGVYWGTSGPLCKQCDPPRSIIWQDNNPYCVSGAEFESLVADEETQEIRRQRVSEIYENLIFPKAGQILANESIAIQFGPTVSGRVTPLGTFDDFQGVLEYFYGLAASATTRVINVNVRTLISTGNRVGVRTDILFNRTATSSVGPAGSMYNLTQTGFYEFDENNQVSQFDVSILNLGAAVDYPPDPEIRQEAITEMCSAVTVTPGTCVPFGTFEDFDDCVNFMNSLPFGTWDRANSNTVTCRLLHTRLTVIRPDVHCPHVGKTGGGKCIDFPYDDFYVHDFL